MPVVYIRSFLLIISGLLILSAQQCRQDINPEHLHQIWFHSYEEDTADTEAFRPTGYDFPPARGRRGFEFKPDGEFIQRDIAPTDGNLAVPGRWTLDPAQRTVRIEFPQADLPAYQMQIVELTKDRLVIQKNAQ